ncbi:hypothetical protein Tco_0499233 [Tanacetum coccineum]
MTEQDIPPPTITAMKIPIIRKGEYDIWSMRMRQYICHTDHNLWDVIVNGDLEEEPAPMFHNVADAKSLWEAIKSRFGGNEESKKMQKNVLKHQFENFSTASNEIWTRLMIDKPVIVRLILRTSTTTLGVYEDEMERSLKFHFLLLRTWISFLLRTLSRTNEVSIHGGISQVSSTPCAHDVACSFFAQPTTSPQLENEDFQQIDEDNLEELDS